MAYSLIRFTQPGSQTEQLGVLVDGCVHPLPVQINDLIQNWATWETTVEQLLASGSTQDSLNEKDIRLLAPVQPQQIIQVGANYRAHVIDLAVSHKKDDQSEEEVREQTARMMDKRSEEGLPYFFIGLPRQLPHPTTSFRCRTTPSPMTGNWNSPRSLENTPTGSASNRPWSMPSATPWLTTSRPVISFSART